MKIYKTLHFLEENIYIWKSIKQAVDSLFCLQYDFLIMNYDFKQAEKLLEKEFERVNDIRDFNQRKVLKAFFDNKVAPEHFYTVSGYGHDDLGREVLDKVFAQVFGAEKALVRIHFASGTHTLACALFGNLKYGDKLISVAGAPYDTMQEVIGTAGDEETKRSSLIGNGVLYDEVPLKDGMEIDFEKLEEKIDETVTMVLIQRSKGYSTRKSLSIETIEKICKIVKSKNPNCICFVDNCYGEFVQEKEPIEIGADIAFSIFSIVRLFLVE